MSEHQTRTNEMARSLAFGASPELKSGEDVNGTTPDGWDPGERAYPYFDPNIQSMVYAHHGEWLVSVSPMLFNDRVLLTRRDQYPHQWVAGFCYPKGPAAPLAAMAWDPRTQDHPAGYVRLACDGRDPADLPSARTV